MKKGILLLLVIMLTISLGLNIFVVMKSKDLKEPEEIVIETPKLTEEEKRLQAYRKAHPELDEEEAKKQLLMNLDKEMYTDASPAKNLDSNTVLVNAYNYVKKDYVPSDLELLYTDIRTGEEVKLRKECKDAYLELYAYCQYNNVEMSLASGFKSYEAIEKEYNETKNGFKPGYDERQTGLVCDITFDIYYPLEHIKEDGFYSTFLEHLHEYGFILRYPDDKTAYTLQSNIPYRIRYVGKEAANAIYKDHICLEEYICVINQGML